MEMTTVFPTIGEIKKQARENLKGKKKPGILMSLIYGVIVTLSALTAELEVIGMIVNFVVGLVTPALVVSMQAAYLKLHREGDYVVGDMFTYMPKFFRVWLINLVIGLKTLGWALLLIIPGIVKGVGYGLTYFIYVDNESVGVSEASKKSWELTKGYKWKLFLLDLSFIGWSILCILSLGIGFLWLAPYIMESKAVFYDRLRTKNTIGESIQY